MTDQEAVGGTVAAPGRRAGSRKAARPPRRSRPVVLGQALGVTLAVVAWGYLVWAAIDFGSTARSGDGRAWWFLGLAALGAVACLFAGLLLVARLVSTLAQPAGPAPGPRTPSGSGGSGGKRAAR